MNPTENVIPQIIEYIQKGTAGIIVLPANPTTDAVASATSLYFEQIAAFPFSANLEPSCYFQNPLSLKVNF